jgi:uncharacterized membrane protein
MPAHPAPASPPRTVRPRTSPSNARNVGEVERIASTIGGGLLTVAGLSRRSLGGVLLAGVGGALLFRGTTGHCPIFQQLGINTAEDRPPEPVEITEAVTVNVDRATAYDFWRKLENLPRFMHHLRRVEDLGNRHSRWTAKGPGPLPDLTWNAEIVEEKPGERLVWRSLPGADVHNAGHVSFKDGPHGGTEVRARIAYRPPAGDVGAAVARWLDPVLGQMVKEDIRRFQHVIETGEVPTIEGQPKGQ